MDWRSILTYVVVIIVIIIALNYFQVECNLPEKAKPVKGFMDFEQGPTKKLPTIGPEHAASEPAPHSKPEDDGEPEPGDPLVPEPPSPGPPGP